MAAVTKLWVDGRPIELRRPAELAVGDDMGRWMLRAELPPDVRSEQPLRVSLQFADGKVISGNGRLSARAGSDVVMLQDIEWGDD
jgi:hypothetical protein